MCSAWTTRPQSDYTPTISGTYTVAVMLGTTLEVQNISTSWTSVVGRSGSFYLSLGECTLLNPCEQTKKIAWDATGDDVKEALEALPGVGEIDLSFSRTSDGMNSASPLVTFLTACDIPQINLYAGTIPSGKISIATVTQGVCSMISTSKNLTSTANYPYVNGQLVEERQSITIVCSSVTCPYQLSFRGHVTSAVTPLTLSSTSSDITC